MKKWTAAKIAAAIVGIILVGIGIAFTNGAGLGNDPVGIFYDGIRSALNLSYEQLNIASMLVNFALLGIVFFTGRKYVNIGTLIYIIPNGICVKIGTVLFNLIPLTQTMPVRIACCIIGCVLMYLGIALFIIADIGLDPFTGLSMVFANVIHKDFKYGKWIVDGMLVVIGFVLGGIFGIVTVLTILLSGVVIMFFQKSITKIFLHN